MRYWLRKLKGAIKLFFRSPLKITFSGLGVALFILYFINPALLGLQGPPPVTEADYVEILESAAVKRLMTRQMSITLVAHEGEESLLREYILGPDDLTIIVPVKLSYGYQLDKEIISREDVTVTDELVSIRVPEPDLFGIEINLEAMKYYQKQSLLQKMENFLTGSYTERELMRELKDRTEKYVIENDLHPTVEEAQEDLNEGVGEFLEYHLGRPVEFIVESKEEIRERRQNNN